ncbi:hypothetical protein M436DRAFT_79975 [Aureobasidium namibiae CBS 147.97]|uniref:Uncharacterized protein n=1 Tax=Aureobasidium namibiae CBS 147.97 TaxID=1043004 RepID=A0A074X0K0_9PEZI
MENPLLLQARAAIAGEGLKAKKVCRFTKWLLSTQNKLRTIINRSSTTNTTTAANNKRSCSPSRISNNKSIQQRRIHNEVFGWTSDAWDEMSELSTPASSTTATPPLPPTPTTPQTGYLSREELFVRYEDYTLRRLENAFMQNTTHRRPSCGRKTHVRNEEWEY